MATRIAINGFGRIGRLVLRAAHARDDLEVVAVNDLADHGDLVYLYGHDSVHGPSPGRVEETEAGMRLDGREIPFLEERDPSRLPWGEMEVDVVAECSGALRQRAESAQHLEAGARKVVVSAPMHGDGPDWTVVLGVNEGDYDADRHHLISNASCTTNALAPVAKVLHEAFGIERGLIDTVHAYTTSQALLDTPQRKRRRGRAAALNLVPTTTGAAEATALVLPELEGKLTGLALRAPIPDGSIVDLTVVLGREAGIDEINDALRAAAAGDALREILRVSDEDLVSSDIVGETHSAVVDAPLTMAMGDLAKVMIWYDNEVGYATRMADCAALVGAKV